MTFHIQRRKCLSDFLTLSLLISEPNVGFYDVSEWCMVLLYLLCAWLALGGRKVKMEVH